MSNIDLSCYRRPSLCATLISCWLCDSCDDISLFLRRSKSISSDSGTCVSLGPKVGRYARGNSVQLCVGTRHSRLVARKEGTRWSRSNRFSINRNLIGTLHRCWYHGSSGDTQGEYQSTGPHGFGRFWPRRTSSGICVCLLHHRIGYPIILGFNKIQLDAFRPVQCQIIELAGRMASLGYWMGFLRRRCHWNATFVGRSPSSVIGRFPAAIVTSVSHAESQARRNRRGSCLRPVSSTIEATKSSTTIPSGDGQRKHSDCYIG